MPCQILPVAGASVQAGNTGRPMPRADAAAAPAATSLPGRFQAATTQAKPASPLIVALDLPDADANIRLARKVRASVGMVKVGLGAFVGPTGAKLMATLAKEKHRIFLDLKLYDIPKTVAGAVQAAKAFGVELFTVHASGGRAMLRAAVQARGPGAACAMKILAVTVPTSLDDESCEEIYGGSPQNVAARLGKMALEEGVDGLVCSADHLQLFKDLPGLRVVPGIRDTPPGAVAGDDQCRTASPRDALSAGADLLVVGRPISAAENPQAAARAMYESIADVLGQAVAR